MSSRPNPQPVKPPNGEPILNRPPKPRLLDEVHADPWERGSAASLNESLFPMEAIRQRCALAGYEVPGYPVLTTQSTPEIRFQTAREHYLAHGLLETGAA